MTEHLFIFELSWFLRLMTALMADFTLRGLKKHATLLEVAGS